ncbi:MAG: Mrp/NBP35 family ATP-binding protein [Pseudomonadota bacterium]
MNEPLIMRVREALARVNNPQNGQNIVASGLVKALTVEDGVARFTLEGAEGARAEVEALVAAAKEAVASVEGVTRVTALATAHMPAGASKPPPQQQAGPRGGHSNPFGLQQKKRPRIEEAGETLQDVTSVIAVASGKGGVGKSTVAANLAVALARRGLKVGFLDADIYGPSAPTLFGVSGKPEMADGKIMPPLIHGVKVMSIGLMVEEERALAWRGPMVMGAVRQLMSDVDWGALDILLIDTPPGTGDAHLSLIQSKRLAGAVIVSTPQELALADVRRGVALFRKTDIPVIGVVENMAWLETADGAKQFLFGEGGARRAAASLEAPFLAEIPIYPDLREASDAGTPLAATDHPAADVFHALAEKVADFVKAGA